jgi:CPA1 family monovalent cation:H+ antiporter
VLLVVVGAMLAAVLFAGAGDRLRLPWPVLLLVLGAAAAFVPGIEAPDIEPDLILPLFLPPLLYATAQRTSWALFRLRWRTIAFLAVGLVVVTVGAVAGTLVALTGIGLAAALAIGAAVAPPDPVAVEAVAGPLRVPRRLMATLQSEGLFNDATALVIFQTAVAAAVAGDDLGALGVALGFLYGAVVAVAIGLGAAWLAGRVLDRLTDVVASNGLTLVLPFAVYLAADALHASGVIAVVVAALQLRQHSDADASEARLTGAAFWNVVEMLVTGVAFALIGLELRTVIAQADRSLGTILAHAGIVCGVVVGVRLVWMGLALVSIRGGRPTPAARAVPATAGEALVLGWAGMRGLATLALALALPTSLDTGAPFPRPRRARHRGLLGAGGHAGRPGPDAAGAGPGARAPRGRRRGGRGRAPDGHPGPARRARRAGHGRPGGARRRRRAGRAGARRAAHPVRPHGRGLLG